MILRTKIIAAIPAIAFFLDIAFYRYQKQIYDQFYKWWFHLAELRVPAVVQRAIDLFTVAEIRICGPKLISIRSTAIGITITITTTLTAAYLILPHEPAPAATLFSSAITLALFNLPVGLPTFFLTRLLVRILRYAESLPLATVITLVAVMIVETLVLAFWFIIGGIAAMTLKTEYVHGVSVDGAVATFTIIILFALGYTRGLIHIALVPLYLFIGFVAIVLIAHLVGKLCLFIRNFLEWQIETLQFAAFTVISAAIAAILELIFLVGDTVPARAILQKLADGHEAAARQSSFNGITMTWKSFLADNGRDPHLTLYLNKVADGLQSYGRDIAAGKADYVKAAKLFVPRVAHYMGKRYGVQVSPTPTPTPPETH